MQYPAARPIWVFAYGSLMSDGWERAFDGSRHPGAALHGFHRDFIKKSTVNWGSTEAPCPTLGLRREPAERCVGVAFRFSSERAPRVAAYLRGREGPTFEFEVHPVALPDERQVEATVAVNRLDTPAYLGDRSLQERAAMVGSAVGTFGSCSHYVESARQALARMGVRDPHVDRFVEVVAAGGDRG